MSFDFVHTCYSALDNCENVEQSYGEICVRCNKCGRFTKKETQENNIKEV